MNLGIRRYVPQKAEPHYSQSFGPFPPELKQNFGSTSSLSFNLSLFKEDDLVPEMEEVTAAVGDQSGSHSHEDIESPPVQEETLPPNPPHFNMNFVPLTIVIEEMDPNEPDLGNDGTSAKNAQATHIRFVKRDGTLYPKVIKQKLLVLVSLNCFHRV